MFYKLECLHVDPEHPFSITVEFHEDCLPEIVENFKQFLRGAGFHEGNIQDYFK